MEPINEEVKDPNGVGVSSKRTGINTTIVLMIVGVIGKAFGKEIVLTGDTLVLVSAALGFLAAIGYRLSRAISAKWPATGWVLFGSGKEPVGLKKIGD